MGPQPTVMLSLKVLLPNHTMRNASPNTSDTAISKTRAVLDLKGHAARTIIIEY